MGVVIEYKLFSTSFPHTQPLNATQKNRNSLCKILHHAVPWHLNTVHTMLDTLSRQEELENRVNKDSEKSASNLSLLKNVPVRN